MSTEVIPDYDLDEGTDILQSEAEALEELGRTRFVTSASPFGAASVQAVAYPTHEEREDVKANIKGEL